jgi:hypothetical protein
MPEDERFNIVEQLGSTPDEKDRNNGWRRPTLLRMIRTVFGAA